jgi:hypothetical protein
MQGITTTEIEVQTQDAATAETAKAGSSNKLAWVSRRVKQQCLASSIHSKRLFLA